VSVVIVGVVRRKPVLTHASIVCEGMLASVNSVKKNSQSLMDDWQLKAVTVVRLERLRFNTFVLLYRRSGRADRRILERVRVKIMDLD